MAPMETTLHIDDGGTGGLPVIFLHSAAGHTGHWTTQLELLRLHRRALAIDLPGHGRSPHPHDGIYSIESLSGSVKETIDALGIERYVLVGHSLGASVAGSVAAADPQRTAGLLLVDPPGDSTQMPPEEVAQILGALHSPAYDDFMKGYWRQILDGSTEETVQQLMADLDRAEKEMMIALVEELFAHNPVPAVQAYPGPKLSVIVPVNDTPISLHNQVSDLPVQEITATGHWLQLDKPAEFNDFLNRFLNQVESG